MASNPIVSPVTLLVNRVKVGEATGGSLKINTGTERIPTNDSIAFTTGKTVADTTFKTVIPRAGMKVRLMEAVLLKEDVKLQFAMDSKFYEIDGKLTAGSVDWDHASGKLEGDWTHLGGEPVLLG